MKFLKYKGIIFRLDQLVKVVFDEVDIFFGFDCSLDVFYLRVSEKGENREEIKLIYTEFCAFIQNDSRFFDIDEKINSYRRLKNFKFYEKNED